MVDEREAIQIATRDDRTHVHRQSGRTHRDDTGGRVSHHHPRSLTEPYQSEMGVTPPVWGERQSSEFAASFRTAQGDPTPSQARFNDGSLPTYLPSYPSSNMHQNHLQNRSDAGGPAQIFSSPYLNRQMIADAGGAREFNFTSSAVSVDEIR